MCLQLTINTPVADVISQKMLKISGYLLLFKKVHALSTLIKTSTMYRVVVVVCLMVTASCNVQHCGNPPPGVNKQRKGVDITKLDLLPLDFNTIDGFLRPVIDYTCNEGKTWTNHKQVS